MGDRNGTILSGHVTCRLRGRVASSGAGSRGVEILASARAVVAQDGYDDLDLFEERGERSMEVIRQGALPVTGRYASVQEHDAALLRDVQASGDRGVAWNAMAVLCQTNALAALYVQRLTAAGVPAVLLTGAGKQAQEEKAELLRRTQFVAMTRARDRLWVGHVAGETRGREAC